MVSMMALGQGKRQKRWWWWWWWWWSPFCTSPRQGWWWCCQAVRQQGRQRNSQSQVEASIPDSPEGFEVLMVWRLEPLLDKILSTPRVLRKDHGQCAVKLIKTSGNLSLVHFCDPSFTRFATKCCKLSSSKKETHFSFPLRSKKLLKNVELKTSPPDIRVFQRKSACSFSNNYSKQKFLCKI